jgi:hypothetical protein
MMDGTTSETCRVLCKNNKFEKLVRLVGSTVGIYYDALTYECQKGSYSVCMMST